MRRLLTLLVFLVACARTAAVPPPSNATSRPAPQTKPTPTTPQFAFELRPDYHRADGGIVRGRVTGVGGKPIDATVSIISETNAAIRGGADERGEFAFTQALKPGRYRLQFEYADMQFVGEIEVRGGSTTTARLDNWFEPVEELQGGEPL